MLQVTDEVPLTESLSCERTLTTVNCQKHCAELHAVRSASSRQTLWKQHRCVVTLAVWFGWHCQIPLAAGIPSSNVGECLFAHRKDCHPCHSAPSSPLGCATPIIPAPLPSSPPPFLFIAYLTSRSCGFPTPGLNVFLPSFPVPAWAQDLSGSSLGVRHAWSSDSSDAHTQTSLWRRETGRGLREECWGAWES